MHLQPQDPAYKSRRKKTSKWFLFLLLCSFVLAMTTQLWFGRTSIMTIITHDNDHDDTSPIKKESDIGMEHKKWIVPFSSNNYNDDWRNNKSLSWTIFYNIFIPTNHGSAGLANTKRIVTEQINMIRNSLAIPQDGSKTVHLFYNTIGQAGIVNQSTFMQRLCSNNNNDDDKNDDKNDNKNDNKILSQTTTTTSTKNSPHHHHHPPIIQCHHMKHYDNAFEEVTLQRMYEFCLSHPDNNNNNLRVSYIHTKGSYHDHADRRNEYWRQHGTLAAVDEQCVDPPEKTCNLCGLQFWTQWTPFIPGNFFTTSCSYVKELVSPVEFKTRMDEITKDVLFMKLQGLFEINLFTEREDRFGVGRYAAEHWIGSHPRLKPCDLSRHNDFAYWITSSHSSKEFSFGLAPRYQESPVKDEYVQVHDPNDSTKMITRLELVSRNVKLRIQEFFFLAGRLYKYYRLYGEYPPDDSWVWFFFPDGEHWKSVTKKIQQQQQEQQQQEQQQHEPNVVEKNVIQQELDRVKNLQINNNTMVTTNK